MTKQTRHRTAPKKQLRAVQTSRHLHTVPRRHTGHVLPRHATSYPVLVMIVLCVGVLLGSWTVRVTADQGYTVDASVPGPPPSIPATIDSPAPGARITSTPVTIAGTCPPDTYVAIMRNKFSSGVALCDATGHYQLAADLFTGADQLVVYDFSLTDAQGPASNSVPVSFAPLTTSSSTTSSGSTVDNNDASSPEVSTLSRPYAPGTPLTPGVTEPLILKSNFTFLGYYIGQPASWQIDIEGGTPPYAIAAAWGDGSQRLYSQAKAGGLSLRHIYAKTGGFRGSYVVKITATDAKGRQTFLQLLSIVNAPPKTVAANSKDQAKGGGLVAGVGNILSTTNLGRMVAYTWSGYGVVLLMLFSFWLGERRELRYLHLRPKRSRHA